MEVQEQNLTASRQALAEVRVVPCPCASHDGARGWLHARVQSLRLQAELSSKQAALVAAREVRACVCVCTSATAVWVLVRACERRPPRAPRVGFGSQRAAAAEAGAEEARGRAERLQVGRGVRGARSWRAVE
jgi:hypothetical protein